MKIFKSDFIFHLGDVITVKNSDIKDGEYQIVEADGEREILFDIRQEKIIEINLSPNIKYEIWTIPPTERLELLYDAFVKISIDTMDKSEDNEIEINTGPWVQKANMIKMLLKEEL